MKKIFLINFCLILIFSSLINPIHAEENLLTLKQQLDRMQREVNDLSKAVFQNSNISLDDNSSNMQDNQTVNFAAIDMRIYDIEKDIKNLNMNLEEVVFKLDEINTKIIEMKSEFEMKLENYINNNSIISKENQEFSKTDNNDNSLGELVITSAKDGKEISDNLDQNIDDSYEDDLSLEELSPEEQFQLAFDQIRNKKYAEAKKSFLNFINKNKNNQLSGSAHYWLGELHLLDKNYREAALILAEGYQNYPESIKAPDMLYKLSEALLEIDKKKEACNTLSKISNEFSTSKIKNKAEKKKLEISCDVNTE